MTQEQLKDSIAHARRMMQLALEAKQRDLLGNLVAAIAGAPSHVNTVSLEAGPDTLLDQQVVEFESGHPKLTGGLREVMDSLNKMGI